MPDRLALYPQEVCGAAIERAILDLEATAWDRTPGETFPSAPETHAASFVLLEGERAVCHVGIRRARLLHRGQSYAVCGLSEVVTHPLRRGQGLATALCLRAGGLDPRAGRGSEPLHLRAGARRPLRQGGLGANPGRLPRGGNMRRILRTRTSFWSWGEDSFGKKRAPALPILRKRRGARAFWGERGDYASANSWGADPQSAWSAVPSRFSAQRMA